MAEHDEAKQAGHDGASHGGGGGGHGAHGGGGGHEEHEGAPEWLISFADNVALIMGFFVILLAMNMQKPSVGGIGGDKAMGGQPTDKMLDFVIAMRREFNNPIDLDSDNAAEAILRKRIRDKEAGDSNQVGDPGPGREHQAIFPTDFSNLGGKVYFEDESVVLSERAREQVRTIGSRIADQRFIVEVRGHVSPSEAQGNPVKAFNLAHERTMSVRAELAGQGVSWRQMRLATCADNERTTTRDASYNREADRQNQRVEVIVTGEVFGARDKAQQLPESTPGGTAEHAAPGPKH